MAVDIPIHPGVARCLHLASVRDLLRVSVRCLRRGVLPCHLPVSVPDLLRVSVRCLRRGVLPCHLPVSDPGRLPVSDQDRLPVSVRYLRVPDPFKADLRRVR